MLNAAASFGQQAVNMGLQVFLLAFILRRVSEKEYGLYLIATTVQGMVWLLRDAIGKGNITQVARYRERGDMAMINKVISSSTLLLLAPAVLTMAAVLVLAGTAANFFDLDPGMRQTLVYMMYLAGLDVLLVLPLFSFNGVIQASQRYDILSWVTIVFRLIRAAAIVMLFAWVKADVLFVMLATIISDVGIQIVLMLYCVRLSPGLQILPRHFDRAVAMALVAFGSYIVAASVLNVGSQELSKWIIGKMLDLSLVTALTVAAYLLTIVRTVVQTMTLVLVPVATRYQTLGQETVMREMLVRGTRYSCLASAAATVGFLPVMGPVLSVWLKPELGWVGPFAAVVGLVGVVCTPGDCAQQILNGMGDAKRPCYVTIWAAAVSLASLVLMVGVLGWGFTGAIVSFCIGMVIFWLGMTILAIRSIRVSLRTLAVQAYLHPLLPLAPALAAGYWVSLLAPPLNWGSLSVSWLAGSAAYLVCFLPFVTRQEWDLVRRGLSRLRQVGASK